MKKHVKQLELCICMLQHATPAGWLASRQLLRFVLHCNAEFFVIDLSIVLAHLQVRICEDVLDALTIIGRGPGMRLALRDQTCQSFLRGDHHLRTHGRSV